MMKNGNKNVIPALPVDLLTPLPASLVSSEYKYLTPTRAAAGGCSPAVEGKNGPQQEPSWAGGGRICKEDVGGVSGPIWWL